MALSSVENNGLGESHTQEMTENESHDENDGERAQLNHTEQTNEYDFYDDFEGDECELDYCGYNDEMDEYDESDEESSSDGFHELYLQQGGLSFDVPISFEDGMDYVECELYYAAQQDAHKPGPPVASPMLTPSPRSAMLKPFSRKRPQSCKDPESDDANLPSCIRPPSANNKGGCSSWSPKPKSKRKLSQRRCSFSGMPPIGRPQVQRSMSHEDVLTMEAKVCFAESVSVVTIPTAYDYPEDIRSNMWMTRKELNKSMRRAMAENYRKKQQRRNHRPPQQQQIMV